jgi:hypothetical protein
VSKEAADEDRGSTRFTLAGDKGSYIYQRDVVLTSPSDGFTSLADGDGSHDRRDTRQDQQNLPDDQGHAGREEHRADGGVICEGH